MRRALGYLLAAMTAGCSGLTEDEGGVVGIEVQVPGPDSLEVGESIQLAARPLDKNGDSVAATVVWVSVDPTAVIDASTGVLTGVSVGSARGAGDRREPSARISSRSASSPGRHADHLG